MAAQQRVAEDLFAYRSSTATALPDGWVKELAGWARRRGWTVSLQGRKIYAVPQAAHQERGDGRGRPARDRRATGCSPPVTRCSTPTCSTPPTAGRARHGELADSGWSAPHVEVTAASGVAAGEEIVRWLGGEAARS